MNTNKKKTYFKITAKSCEDYWVCDDNELENEIADWVSEYGRVTIKEIKMTEEEFYKLKVY